jgi:NTP pyrophosphatase (non-canonical NTP hydrolase)
MRELRPLFDLYQEFVPTTAVYPDAGKGTLTELLYLFCGLLGEEQEWYESNYDIKEAGDVFWYTAQICSFFGISFANFMIYTKPEQFPKPNVHEAMKKYIRDGKPVKETLFEYMRAVVSYVYYRYHFGTSMNLEETIKVILVTNRDKLVDRQNRDVIQGDGDNR